MSIINSVITIGTFDGVHVGHQKIIERLLHSAKHKNLRPVILTFFPHPRMVLQANFKAQLLHTISERKSILKEFGVKDLVVKPFTREFAKLSAEDYIKNILVEELKAKHVIIGYDHRFGKNRSADINDMKSLGAYYGFTVEEIAAQDIRDIAVSSTKIRTALSVGQLDLANTYLGYNYFITGTVVRGKGLGRTINFPTANLNIEEAYKLIPKQGVYVIKSTYKKELVYGMMNIGTNPTVDGKTQTIEIHFFDFSKDIYGEQLKIEMLHRLRDEKKFDSVEKLTEQLKNDRREAKNYIETYC